jgi:hypothetical protein
MTMEIEQGSGFSIFAAKGWSGEVDTHSTRKWAGEQAEAAFLNKATSLGLSVSKPWGDSERYDFVVDAGRRMLRVQVKSTAYQHDGRCRYSINALCHAALYTEDEIDFLAVYIVPLDLWYIIPVKACLNRKSLRFYPKATTFRSRYEKYREAWWRLQSKEVAKRG